MNQSYQLFFTQIKTSIKAGRTQAIKQVTKVLIELYWTIGQHIVENQQKYGWGKSIVEKLARDLKNEFPNQTGFSARNLWVMKQLYETYKDFPNLQQAVAEIPWGQNMLILNKTKSIEEKEYYIKMSAKMGWSRNVLLHQIKANSYERHLLEPKQNNFEKTLPKYLAEQANEAIKSSYNLEFLGLKEQVLERELEERLLRRLKNFLLELGYGFTFVGDQYPLSVNGKTYRVDLLFFHRKLRSMIAIDLKSGSFQPDYIGKMGYYLEVLDDKEKFEEENPSIGIILCTEKDELLVEYALRTSNKPMGVVEYKLSPELPQEYNGKLPTPEELKQEIGRAWKLVLLEEE